MFIHALLGTVVFKFGMPESSFGILLAGMVAGLAPDILSLPGFQADHWGHRHREGFFHSIGAALLFGVVCYFGASVRGYPAWASAFCTVSAYSLHLLVDMFGIGWGVALFWPISKNNYKFFYEGKLVIRLTPKDVDEAARKHGRPDWIRAMYLPTNPKDPLFWWGLLDYVSLVGTIWILY